MKNEQLKAFIAVVEQGSFRAAATTLFKAQPTVSASVSALETQFGIRLFNRNSYRPTLTTEGKAFYRQAKQLIKQVGELEMLGYELAKGEVPTLTLSLSAMCASPQGLDSIKQFCQKHPDISIKQFCQKHPDISIKQFCQKHPDMRLDISTENLSGVLERLQLEQSDLAIGPDLGLDERHEYVEVTRVNMVTVAVPHYVASNDEGVVPQQSLRSLPHILIPDTGSIAPSDHVNVLPSGQRWYVNDFQMKKALLLSGMGWARIPEHMVEQELKAGALVRLQVESFNYESLEPIYLIRLKQAPLSQLAKMFWEEVVGSFGES